MRAQAGAQVVDAHVDRAQPREAVHHLLGRLVGMLVGHRQHHRVATGGIQRGGDHATMQPAVDVVADQVGPHVERHAVVLRVHRDGAQAEHLVEADAQVEQLAQGGVDPLLFFGGATGRRGLGHVGAGSERGAMLGGAQGDAARRPSAIVA